MATIGDAMRPNAEAELRRWVDEAARIRATTGPEVYDRELARLQVLAKRWPAIEDIEDVLKAHLYMPATSEDWFVLTTEEEILLTTMARAIMALFLPVRPNAG